jgi:hypothetical protein
MAALAILGGISAGALYHRIAVTRVETHQRTIRDGRRVDRLRGRASSDIDRQNLVDAFADEIRKASRHPPRR